jgi:putative transposase
MSIQFLPGKLKGEERKAIIQEIQKQLQQAAIEAIRPLLTAFCEEELTAKLGRGKREGRRVSVQAREIDWYCGHCGCRDAHQFMRDGHYRRTLETGWGRVEGLQVPMLECQRCGHDVVCSYTILEKHRRFWLDLDQQALYGTGFCQSLRELSQEWSAKLNSSVGVRTINERINQIEPLLERVHTAPLTDVPAVVQFDGIWLRQQSQTDIVKVDKRGRKRHQRSGKKVVLLVALGFWPDGRREIIDWEVTDSEAKAAWERLVHRLWERGLRPEKGLQAVIRDGNGELGEAIALVYGTTVVEQRCIFHKLKNVADKSRKDLKGKSKKDERQQLLEQARAVYDAENVTAARMGLAEFVTTWRERAPKAVATFERDFEQTIAYYRLEGTTRQLIRTTSLLERTNRELRRKFRQACCFGSPTGAQVAIYLQIQRYNARWSKEKKTWWQISQALYFDFLALNP